MENHFKIQMMDSRSLLALSREGMASRPHSSSPLPHTHRGLEYCEKSRPWNTVISSIVKGAVTEGRARDELLKECLHPYWGCSHTGASQPLLAPLWTVCWVREACRSRGLDPSMWAPRASQQSGSSSNQNCLNICSTFMWRRGCQHRGRT